MSQRRCTVYPRSEYHRWYARMPQDCSTVVSMRRKGSLLTALPVSGTKLIQAVTYAHSISSSTAKLEVQLFDSTVAYYFLKVTYNHRAAANCNKLMGYLSQIITGPTAMSKCESEYEALKAIYAVSPGFAAKPHAWGKLKVFKPEAYFLLEDFVKIRQQVCSVSFILGLVRSSLPDSPRTPPRSPQA